MSRTFSVALSLSILILALWIAQSTKVIPAVFGTSVYVITPSAPGEPAPTDAAATAVEDLAGWPIAAGR